MSASSPPVVQIVGPTDGWVLERLARRLAAKLPYAGFAAWRPQPRPAGGLAYYVNYALFDRPSGLVDVGFLTHRDDAHGFLDRACRLDHCVCMAAQYADWLRDRGVAAVTHIPMGFDAHRYAPRLVLGVAGRLDHPRKGRALVERVRRLPFVDVLTTEGNVAEEDLRDWYQRLDYVLIPATVEGGPMSLLEGLAAGKPVIAPAGVGIVPELGPTPRMHLYPAGDGDALARLVEERYEAKRNGLALLGGRTWDDWAAAHDALFRRLLAERRVAVPEPAPGFRFGLAAELAAPPGTLTAAHEAALDEAARHLFAGDRPRAKVSLATVAAAHPAAARLLDPPSAPRPAVPPPRPSPARSGPVRVAVISLLFDWPTTGGGNVHTAELTRFLAAAGYDARHLYAKFDPWRIGRVTEPTPHPAEAVVFGEREWTAAGIAARFRRELDRLDPDWVVLTDSWNLKPLLADACGGRPYILRLQALECLCPLNNVRLRPGPDGRPEQCPRHQLATPDACAACVRDHGHTSGDLHRAERDVAGVGTPGYREVLFRAFAGAAAVLAVNPLAAAMVEPHADRVLVVTAGMDPARFPSPFPADRAAPPTPGRLRLLFAGLVNEWMKGFHVLRAAAERLWAVRQDFEVVATDDPPQGGLRPWERFVGWQPQAALPAHLAGADVVVVPTVAQEALGRTAVEGMAAGKAVAASRLGGLPFTVADGATGLLCQPNDPDDLAAKLAVLLDDAGLRARLGAAGRQRFDEHYAWPAIIDRHYRPLLGDPTRRT